MTLNDVKNALLTVTPKVWHYTAPSDTTCPYLIWMEDGQSEGLYGDGKMVAQTITGSIHYFTKIENDPNYGEIQKALNDAGIPFSLEAVQFEEDTRIIHTHWDFEVSKEV